MVTNGTTFLDDEAVSARAGVEAAASSPKVRTPTRVKEPGAAGFAARLSFIGPPYASSAFLG
jgi:hypothetical protein